MRRKILLALGLGVIGAALGCHHVAGVCDCEGPRQPCNQGEAAVTHDAPPPMIHAEPVKEAPKVLDK